MKIAFVGGPPVSKLGTNFQVYYPVRELSELGHHVDWIYPTEDGRALPPNPACQLSDKVRLVPLSSWSLLIWNPIVHLAYTLLRRVPYLQELPSAIDLCRSGGGFTPQLSSHLVKNPPDVIHALPFPFSRCWFAARAKRLAKVPLILSPYFNIGSPRYYNPLLIRSLLSADFVHVTTEAERAEIESLGVRSNRIRLIPNAIDVSEWEHANAERFRLKFHLGEKRVVLYPGRKEEAKGALSALVTMRKVLANRSDTVFVAAGYDTPEWGKALNEFGGRGIISLPFVSGRDRLDMFAAADIVFLPSRSDASPTVFLEGWALKKPAVAARTPAAEEYVRDETDGLLADVADSESLQSAIEYLLDNEDARTEYGLNGRSKVVENHDWKRVRHQYVAMYEDATRNAEARGSILPLY